MDLNKKISISSPKKNSFQDAELIIKNKKKIKINRESLVRKEEKHVSLYYDIEDIIGEGSFGKVYKIKHKKLK